MTHFLLLLFVVVLVVAVRSQEESYAIVVDAGSTGSRAFVFRFLLEDDGVTRKVESTKGEKVEPGLSSFVANPVAAAKYLAPVLQHAVRLIPPRFYASTNVYIKGTAGMRLLKEEDQKLIWRTLAHNLNAYASLPVYIEESNLGTIDGFNEAFYAVLSSNYIARTIDGNLHRIKGKQMVGALDMGGSSTQLIFHVETQENAPVKREDFWSHSWLSMGVEKVRERVWDWLIEKEKEVLQLQQQQSSNDAALVVVENPCSFPGHELTHPTSGYVLRGTGDSKKCSAVIRETVWQQEVISKCVAGAPCSIDGIEHPPVDGHFYGMSVYFYALDCIRQLGPSSLAHWPRPTLEELHEATEKFCAISWADEATRQSMLNKHRFTKNDQLPNRCLEGLYMVELLTTGFGFDRGSRNITLALEVEGHEVEWTLGFSLAEIPFAPLAASNNNNNKSDDKESTKVMQQEVSAGKSTSSIGTYKLVVQRFFASISEAIKKLLSKLLAIFHSRKQ